MNASPHSRGAARGFTLLELLVTLFILVFMAAIGLRSLVAIRHHQVVLQCAGEVEAALRLARVRAMADGESVFFTVTGENAVPGHLRHRAYTLLQTPDTPRLLIPWRVLPREVVFGDPLLDDWVQPWEAREVRTFAASDDSPDLVGEAVLLLEAAPDGRFYHASDRRLASVRLSLCRGEWYEVPATATYRLRLAEPREQTRIELRPLSGVTRLVEVLPGES